MSQYLTLDRIKQQVIVDTDFHDDDDYLLYLADVAQDYVEQELDSSLDMIVAEHNGTLPKGIEHCMLLIIDYFYSTNRGSNEGQEIPQAFLHLCQMYRSWGTTR